MNETVVEASARGVIPEDSVAIRRKQHGYGYVRVLLRQINRLAAIVPHSLLVLSEPVESFVRAVHLDDGFAAIRLLAIHGFGRHDALGIAKQLLTCCGRDGDRPRF